MKDILFIHPGNQKKTYQDLAKEYTAVATPAWTLLNAGYLRGKGLDVAVYDVNVEGWDDSCAAELLGRWAPALVVMMVYGHNPSASTQTMPAAGRIAASIKAFNPDVPIAFGGMHPSALPEQTLREEKIDFVVEGEGPYTLAGLSSCLKGGGGLSEVPGLWYREGGEIRRTAPAEPVSDLDADLPGYPWDLLPGLDRYRAHNMHCFQDFAGSRRPDFSDVRTPYVAMNTSLGCPYSCDYCCINSVFGRPRIRYWSIPRVVGWIDELVAKHRVRNIRLDDELFILSPQRVELFCDMIIERKYGLNFWVYGRTDTVRPSLVRKLKRAGVNWVCLGIESANARVLGDVNKRLKGDVAETVRLLQSEDVYVLGNFMFGLPEDDLSTMRETLDFAKALNCEFVNFYSVMAYPGSKLYARAKAADPASIPSDWNAFSQHSYEALPLPTRRLSPEQVLRFRDEAFVEYTGDPGYLRSLEKRFSPQVRSHVERMLQTKVRRRLLEKAGKAG